MNETPSRQFRLGLFISIATAAFLLAIYFVGNKQSLFGRAVPIYAIFKNVNGLQPGNAVPRYRPAAGRFDINKKQEPH